MKKTGIPVADKGEHESDWFLQASVSMDTGNKSKQEKARRKTKAKRGN